ncbi:glycosyltransferase family 4 protein [Marinobacter algicola]|uniref:glycosyltransferase family 4 protein n=1 Tax=Marinobacter algicola TaxID=236100 RepID=UPI003BA94711
MNKTVLFAANRGYALLSSRRTLIERFVSEGWRVVLATTDDLESQKLVELGAELESVAFNRGGFSPLADAKATRDLRNIVKKYSPTLGHFFHAKPVIMGSFAMRAKTGQPPVVVNTITGLGHAFVQGGLVTRLASAGYRKALPKADITIFQNRDDMALFLENGWLANSKARLIAGSGVPLDRFSFVDRSMHDPESPVIVMLGRLLKQKGIPEFVNIASEVRKKVPGARFVLAGEEEPNHPDGVDLDWLKASADIEYMGRLSDVLPLLNEADLLLFPSYYREGVPRVVMEAAATGLPTVAFDVPGVREAVHDKKTGFLVANRDLEQMTERVIELLRDQELRLTFGHNANELAKEAFDIRAVQEAYLNIYRELGVHI